MASLDNSHNAIPRFVDLPGFPERTVGVWRIKAMSASDTVTVPELDTRSASADQSSVRVLEPATGVTATAAAASGAENVVTLAGATRDQELIMFTVHFKGRSNSLSIPNPA
jgi:hypothetical protein